MNKTIQKGFTLIELLVVIAIIGILAAVVLVAINPAQRIAEANDSKVKSNVGQVATALEGCFTANQGEYKAGACDSVPNLSTATFLKSTITGVTVTPFAAVAGKIPNAIAFGTLTASSAVCDTTLKTGTKFLVYRTETGDSKTECYATGNPTLAKPAGI